MTTFTEIANDEKTWLIVLIVSITCLAFSIYGTVDLFFVFVFSLWSVVSWYNFQELREEAGENEL